MRDFEVYEDVEDWLAPMGYEAFWQAVLSAGLYGEEDRAHCDRTLAEGIADMETVMSVTKRMALHRMVERLDLPFRCEVQAKPDLSVVE